MKITSKRTKRKIYDGAKKEQKQKDKQQNNIQLPQFYDWKCRKKYCRATQLYKGCEKIKRKKKEREKFLCRCAIKEELNSALTWRK